MVAKKKSITNYCFEDISGREWGGDYSQSMACGLNYCSIILLSRDSYFSFVVVRFKKK